MKHTPKFYSLKTLSVFFLTLFLFVSCESNSESSNNTEASEDKTSVQNVDEEQEEEASNTCGVCGRTFSGNGFEEQMDGSWTELEDPYQSSVCSPSCGRKSVQELNDVAEKYGIDLGEENSAYGSHSCLWCGKSLSGIHYTHLGKMSPY